MILNAIELRATMGLARLLAKQAGREKARAMLAEIYDWFTEWRAGRLIELLTR